MSRTVQPQRLGEIPAVTLSETPALPRNTVLHGDCIKVLASLPAGCMDFVLTDPPYPVNYRDRSGRTVANDNDPAWLNPAFAGIARVMKPDTLMVSFYGWQVVDQFLAADRRRSVGSQVNISQAEDTRCFAACPYPLMDSKPASTGPKHALRPARREGAT